MQWAATTAAPVGGMEGGGSSLVTGGSSKLHPLTIDLELKVQGFFTAQADGTKVFTKNTVLNWVVEVEGFTLGWLMESLTSAVKCDSTHRVSVWFFDKRLGEDVKLVDDVQIVDLIEMYKAEMRVELIVGVLDRSLLDDIDLSCEPPLERLPPTVVPNEPSTVNQLCPPAQRGSANPLTGQEASASQNADVADASEPDIFDNLEEYVGVDVEHIYGSEPLTDVIQFADNTQGSKSIPTAAEGECPPEAEVDDVDPEEVNVLHDPNNPQIVKLALFPDMVAFRKAIRNYAITNGFEFANLKTDPSRYIAYCAHDGCLWRIHASAHDGCLWRIHASKLQDSHTIQIKKVPYEHNCPTTKLREGKMASQGWIVDKVTDWLKKNPNKTTKDAKEKLEDEYQIKLKYNKAWSGMKLALDQIHGSYEESFRLLFNWKAEVERVSPDSVVEIELEKVGNKQCFKRIFIAFRPCVDGFLAGCRPYIGVDSTTLHGRYTGQLASATAVDGHNWLFYVAYAIFDAETDKNWLWFMQQLNKVVGSPTGLVISTDACKRLEKAVSQAFAEHRECMRHLYQNFTKKYQGPVFTQHLYPAARSFIEERFRWHMQKILLHSPDAIQFLDTHHSRIWYRCGFSELSKCDYLTNNVSESFNKQIKPYKALLLHELVDSMRVLVMEKMAARRDIGRHMDDGILPNVVKELNEASKSLRVVKIARSDDDFAEVTLVEADNNTRRHIVDLQNHRCSCRQWQITGKPCSHALAWICANRGNISQYVHEYYSVQKFRAAYAGRIANLRDRTLWPDVDLGFTVNPPKLRRAPGRPRVVRIRGALEAGGPKKKVKCKRCGGWGHFEKTCKMAEADENGEPFEQPSKKRKRQDGALTSKKKGTPKKKKRTPKKRRQQATSSAPPARVVRRLSQWLGDN